MVWLSVGSHEDKLQSTELVHNVGKVQRVRDVRGKQLPFYTERHIHDFVQVEHLAVHGKDTNRRLIRVWSGKITAECK